MHKSLANRLRRKIAQAIAPDDLARSHLSNTGNDNATDIETFAIFCRAIQTLKPRVILEAGTAQAVKGISTHNFRLFPDAERINYKMIDILAGPDVDVVADLHQLPAAWTSRFEAFIAIAVFEHLERPWLAAKEIGRVLAPGGICYISTHQTFPLHGYPKDFFRFSTDALALIFADAGLEIMAVGYKNRTKIILPSQLLHPAHMETWNAQFPSYALVNLAARKPVSA